MNSFNKSFFLVAIFGFFTLLNKEASSEEKVIFTSRIQAVKYVLDHFKRPVTVLEVGARDGEISFQIAQEYDSSCVMIYDRNLNNNALQHRCEEKDLSNIILLSKKITLKELKNLSECEHFDVVLAFHVEEDFGKDSKIALRKICSLGDHILIEASSRDQASSSFISYLKTKMGVAIGEFPEPSDPKKTDYLYWFFSPRDDLKRKAYCLPTYTHYHHWVIKSSFEEKKLEKYIIAEFVSENPWLPGINLLTFKFLNGTYPSKETLKQSVEALSAIPSNDWLPHNIIVQGKNCILIDCADTHIGQTCVPYYFTDKTLALVKEFINEDDPNKLKECKLIPGKSRREKKHSKKGLRSYRMH